MNCIAELAMEIAFPPAFLEKIAVTKGTRAVRDAALSTSVGGIGPLLRERIMEQGEQGLPVIGITLLYDTTWIQSWFQWGQLHLAKRVIGRTLREILEDTGIVLSLPLYTAGENVSIKVWKLAYGKATVYFLDCPTITSIVYPSEEDAPPHEPNPAQWGEELRHKQSWLIGRGALALLKTLGSRPDFIVLSETPTLFGHHRLALDAFHKDPFFEQTRYLFNDHTPLEYAHPVWNAEICRRVKLDSSSYLPIPNTAQTGGEVDITRLLIGLCDGVFGVAKKHGDVMKRMPSLHDYADKISSITNGVSPSIWQDSDYAHAEALSDDALLHLKDRKKKELLEWTWRRNGLWHTWKEQIQDKPVVLWTRRITGYKRLDILGTICRDPGLRQTLLDTQVVLFIGGRIHQHDDQAQGMIYSLLDSLSQDSKLQERIVFLDNFNVWMAPHLFRGSDAAIMLADDGREASATGFMKAQLNGNLIIASNDGAIPESVTFLEHDQEPALANGIEVPYRDGHPTVDGFLSALQKLHSIFQRPSQRARMIRSALQAHHQISISRTVEETKNYYDRLLTKKS